MALPSGKEEKMKAGTQENEAVEWEREKVKHVCSSFVSQMYADKKKKSASSLRLATEGLVMNRLLPQVTLSGKDAVMEHLQESVRQVSDLVATPTNVIVDANRCAVEYKLRGTFGGNEVWGISIPRSVEGGPKEFEGAMSISVASRKRDERQAKKKSKKEENEEEFYILRIDEYLDPYNFVVSMGGEPRVFDIPQVWN